MTDRTSQHIPSLDGIRAICVLLVFVTHAGHKEWIPGAFGVTVFFFLSGFLITTLLRQEYDKTRDISIRNFMMRRVLRIWPAFYLVLLTAIIVAEIFQPGTLKTPAVMAQLLHFTNYWIIHHTNEGGQPNGTSVYWSLSVEEHFYLAFPWVYLAMRRLKMSGRDQAFTLWGICAVVLAWRSWLVTHGASVERTYLATDTRIDSILFGCALAVWNSPVVDRPRLDVRAWTRAVIPLSFAVLLLCFVIRSDAFMETLAYSIQGIALNVVFVAAIRFKDWWAFRWLNSRAMMLIGALSFSIYLIHFSVLQAVQRAFPTHAYIDSLFAFAITVSLAWIIYQVVERPCARLRQRFTFKPIISPGQTAVPEVSGGE